MRGRTRLAVVSCLLALLAAGTVLGLSAGAATLSPSVPVTVQRIAAFQIGDPEVTRFGALEFVGGLQLSSRHRAIGGLSGLVMTEADGSAFLAITDDGLAFQARILRDAAGRPVDLADGRAAPLRDRRGKPFRGKLEADTEALDVRDGAVVISVEGRPRILAGRLEPDGFPGPLTEMRLPPATAALKGGKGLETVVIGRPGGPFAGAVVTIGEDAPRNAKSRDNPGWLIGGPAPGAFRVANDGTYSITDAKFGPGDDLFILERAYSWRDGVRCRIRRIRAADLKPGARIDGPVLMEANLSHQIDNMEALALWTDGEGRTRLSLLSDDNRSFLQRTVYLEFTLTGP